MPMWIPKDSPVLKACIDCLLSTAKARLHADGFRWIGNALWALDLGWSLSNVAIVGFNTFMLLQVRQHALSEDGDVGVESTWERSIDPNNVACQDTQCNLAPHA